MPEGQHAVLLAPSKALMDVLCDRLEKQGYRVMLVPSATVLDGADHVEQVEAALAPLLQTAGVHTLVNADGLWQADVDPDRALQALLRIVFVASRLAVRSMMRQRSGRIINVMPFLGQTRNRTYALRSGLGALTKSVAREVGSRGITANLVAPGYLDDVAGSGSSRVPLGRGASPLDVADIVAFLAGERAAYVTGQEVRVDGGLDTV